MTSAVLKSFLVEVKLYTLFFFPFALSIHLVEGSIAGPWSIWKVILCMNLFWHLFLPSLFYFIHCQGGILIGTGAKWNEAPTPRDMYATALWESLFSVWWGLTSFPTAVLLGDLNCFPGPVSIIPCLPHSPTPFGSISSDPETWCQCPKIHLNMVTSGLRLAGDYD